MAKWDLIQVCYIIKSATYPSQQFIKEKKYEYINWHTNNLMEYTI